MCKRAMDLVISGLGLVLAIPFILAAALTIRFSLGPPVFFRQTRVGRGERPFTLYKLRTMTDERGPDGALLPHTARLTPVGRVLRRTSIDELPQFWNVLRGDMSLVGPRPLYPEYLPYYTGRERKRHLVRPGLTGLAQIKGRRSTGWDERLEWDVRYVENRTLMLDLRVLLITAYKVLRGADTVERAPEGKLSERRAWTGAADPETVGGGRCRADVT